MYITEEYLRTHIKELFRNMSRKKFRAIKQRIEWYLRETPGQEFGDLIQSEHEDVVIISFLGLKILGRLSISPEEFFLFYRLIYYSELLENISS